LKTCIPTFRTILISHPGTPLFGAPPSTFLETAQLAADLPSVHFLSLCLSFAPHVQSHAAPLPICLTFSSVTPCVLTTPPLIIIPLEEVTLFTAPSSFRSFAALVIPCQSPVDGVTLSWPYPLSMFTYPRDGAELTPPDDPVPVLWMTLSPFTSTFLSVRSDLSFFPSPPPAYGIYAVLYPRGLRTRTVRTLHNFWVPIFSQTPGDVFAESHKSLFSPWIHNIRRAPLVPDSPPENAVLGWWSRNLP